jgi:membrane protein DedA with SNARE-associated domain
MHNHTLIKKTLFPFLFLFFSLQLHCQQTVALDTLQTKQAFVEKNPSLLTEVIEWYTEHLNYGAIVLLMTVESSFIPFPSEVVVPPAAYVACIDESPLHVTNSNLLNVFIVIIFATIGALLGSFINYFLALFLGRPIVYWFADSKLGHLFLLDSEKIKKAEDYFVKYGNVSTFVGRLIVGIRQLISIPAGLAKMKIVPFFFFTFLGAAIWNVILAILGYAAHGQKNLIDQYSRPLSWALLGLVILLLLFFIMKGIIKKGKIHIKN